MGELARKLAKLEQAVLGREAYSHGFGKSVEEIEAEFAELPYWVARRAREHAELREQGEISIEDEIELMAHGSATNALAVIVSYGESGNAPRELSAAAAEISRQARTEPDALPPEVSARLGAFLQNTVARARELFLAGPESN